MLDAWSVAIQRRVVALEIAPGHYEFAVPLATYRVDIGSEVPLGVTAQADSSIAGPYDRWLAWLNWERVVADVLRAGARHRQRESGFTGARRADEGDSGLTDSGRAPVQPRDTILIGGHQEQPCHQIGARRVNVRGEVGVENYFPAVIAQLEGSRARVRKPEPVPSAGNTDAAIS